MKTCQIIMLGAGTAGYALGLALAKSTLAGGIHRLVLVDEARIKETNAISCPQYDGYLGVPKSMRLAEIMQQEVTWMKIESMR